MVATLDRTKSQKYFREFEAFCFGKINATRQIIIKNDVEYELLTRCLKSNGDFKRKYNLESVQFESKPNNSSRGGGKVIFKGKRNQLDNIDLNRLQQFYTETETFLLNDKGLIPFIKYTLERFKRDLIKNLCVYLQYKIENITQFNFEIVGFDESQVSKIRCDLVEDFLKRAMSKTIYLKPSDNVSGVEKIVNDFKKNLNSTASSENEDGDEANDIAASSFKFSVDIDVILNVNQKKIFLNGTNADELEAVKADLQEKLDGSQKCMECKRYSSVVFNCLMQRRFIDQQFKLKFKETRFFVNLDRNEIRLNGPKEQIENALKELDTICSNISDEISTERIEVSIRLHSFT
jgi:hypothetical protein